MRGISEHSVGSITQVFLSTKKIPRWRTTSMIKSLRSEKGEDLQNHRRVLTRAGGVFECRQPKQVNSIGPTKLILGMRRPKKQRGGARTAFTRRRRLLTLNFLRRILAPSARATTSRRTKLTLQSGLYTRGKRRRKLKLSNGHLVISI